MKNLFLLITTLLLLSAFDSSGQDIKWGETVKNKFNFKGILGADSEYFYVFSGKIGWGIGSTPCLEKYKLSDLSRVYAHEIEIDKAPAEAGGDELVPQKLFMMQDKVYFLTYGEMKKGNKYIYIQKFDRATGVPEKDAKLLDTSNFNNKSFEYILLNNNKNFLITHWVSGMSNALLSAKLFDENMSMLWSKSIAFDRPLSEISFVDACVLSDGKLALLMREHELNNSDMKSPNYSLSLWMNDVVDGNMKRTRINTGKSFITDLALACMPDDKIVVAGLYSDDNESTEGHSYTYRSAHGTFLNILTYSNQPEISIVKSPFTMVLMDKAFPDKEGKHTVTEINKIDLTGLSLNDDGGISVLSEVNFSKSETVREIDKQTMMPRKDLYKSSRTEVTYYAKQIIIADYNANGQFKDYNFVIKGQSYEGLDDYISYLHFEKAKTKFLLFNSKNEEEGTLVTINSDGSKSEKIIYNNKELDVRAAPRFSNKIAPGKILLIAKDASHFKFGLLTY